LIAASVPQGRTLSIPVLSGLCRAADILIMAIASLCIGLGLRRMSGTPMWGEFIVVSTIAITVCRVVSERMKVYRLATLLDPFTHLAELATGVSAGVLACMVTLVLLHHHTPDLPYLITQPFAWGLGTGATLLAFRSILASRLQAHDRAGRLTTRVAVIGATAASLKFIKDTAGDPATTIVGIYDDRATRLPDYVSREWLRGSVDDLLTLTKTASIDAIVIALPLSATDRIAAIRERLSGIAADIFLTTDVPALSYAGAQLMLLGSSTVLLVSSRPLKDWPAFKKSCFDRVAGALFLLAALPIILVIAVLVKLESRGPVLFRQDREGLNGTPFTMLKFRTMYCRDANDEFIQATANDRRVTRLGYWLRRFSLDELPQLWNVLRGDMSLVGPRPHLATTLAGKRMFRDVPHYQARHRMKPGLTGWAQVQGLRGETRTEREIVERVAQDLYYIDNWSLGLDLRIIARTLLREIFISSSGKAY
jgi:Undecaprenyl-phosphate glucose phosphotransferase